MIAFADSEEEDLLIAATYPRYSNSNLHAINASAGWIGFTVFLAGMSFALFVLSNPL